MIIDKLIDRIKELRSPICIDLSTTVNAIPHKEILNHELELRWKTVFAIQKAMISFNREVINVIKDLVPAVKIPRVFYEKYGTAGIEAFIETIKIAKEAGLIVIGDINAGEDPYSSMHCAEAYLKQIDIEGVKQTVYDVDFITINPYCGHDTVEAYTDACANYDKGIFVLAKTSNKGGKDFQDILVPETETTTVTVPLYHRVCRHVAKWGSRLIGQHGFSAAGAVVDVSHPAEFTPLRKAFPNLFFLTTPKYIIDDTLQAFRSDDKIGALICSSYRLLKVHEITTYAGMNWEDAIRQAVTEMRDRTRQALDL